MSNKWQRIQYMPGTGLGENGQRVTGSSEHIALSRKAACEGMVLLKNEENALPLAQGQRIAVFGKGQADYVKGGGGSGDVTVAYVRSLLEGLEIKEEEGKVRLFAPLSAYYRNNVKEQRAAGKEPGFTVEPAVPQDLLLQARAFTDTALISICRFSSEGYDRTGEAFDGDFFLSREEKAMVDAVEAKFPRVIVVLNCGGMMDTSWFRNSTAIKAALHSWQAGMEGGLATADLLVGDENPSGHLTDTFAADFAAYPSSANFNESEEYVEYWEDIYVGYRYFETIPGAAEKVCYPFGYGLSYTTFELSDIQGEATDDRITVTATVQNTGCFAGKQVVQVYASAPQGKLGKPARVLVGFAKTELLDPDECQTISISFAPYAFASYDDTGLVQKSAYALEKGNYSFYIGFNVRDTETIDLNWKLDENCILEQLSEKCTPAHLRKRMLADGSYVETGLPTEYQPLEQFSMDIQYKTPAEPAFPAIPLERHNGNHENGKPDTRLIDVFEGKITLDSFMDSLSDEEMILVLGGQPNRGVANTWGFGNLPTHGVPNVMTADGPAGLRIQPQCGVNTTAFPCANLLACTWNEDLIWEVGAAGASEVKENGIGVWLTPAINIHRSPLCGRNFEYYSEDPLVAGRLSAAMVRGIQSEGIAASVKHFCCNNKETNRKDSDSRLSERALREIYIKNFEICVKESAPWTIMSSYNIVNGCRASENHDLLTDILRGEWGFDGIVTTDWWTHAAHWKEINAGNDIKMPNADPAEDLEHLKNGELDREMLRTCVRRLMEMILKLA